MRQFEVKHFEQVAVVTNKKYLLNVYILSWMESKHKPVSQYFSFR